MGNLATDILKSNVNLAYSHDNLFHTVLGLLEIKTAAYNKELDMLTQFKKEEVSEQRTTLTQVGARAKQNF